MVKILHISLAILFMSLLTSSTKFSADGVEVNSTEKEIYKLINEYRKKKKLQPIPLSRSLTYVAQTHCNDLAKNYIHKKRCNMHSWSHKGEWEECCYTPNHSKAECMWNKPRELTKYTGNGYEIAFWSSDTLQALNFAQDALKSWKSSPGHNSVIINRDIWKSIKWNAVGVGVYGGYACVWFGEEKDPAGEIVNK